MSLHDESFPEDEFLEELDLSSNPRHFQFPVNRDNLYKPTISSATNTSSSSTDQNLSSESSNERPGSDLSGKTNASDPTGLSDGKSQKNDGHNKAYSYMDIHSEYTKRRYKHVESKVGQYIAKMKAEDQKIRNNQKKFLRHRSMPETIGREDEITENLDNNRCLPIRYSSAEIQKLHDSSDAEADSSENRSSRNGNELGGNDMLIVQKESYSQLIAEKERVQSYNEYLQQRLDEKSSEVLRLKRNIDYLRIEVTDCQDKLKRQSSMVINQRLNNTLGTYNQGNLSALSRQSTNQVFNQNQTKTSKATQTEMITPSPLQPQKRLIPCEMYTPESLDSNNNSLTDQNDEDSNQCKINLRQKDNPNTHGVLRQRSNSNQMIQPIRQSSNSHRGYPNSSDSTIDIESIEMQSPIGQHFLLEKRTICVSARELLNTSFIEFSSQNETNSNLYSNTPTNLIIDVTDNNNMSNAPNNRNSNENCKETKRKNTLRGRIIRFLGPCVNCNDVSNMEVSFTQAPLLERTPENVCQRK